MTERPPSTFSRLVGRFFPGVPDFFGMLAEQAEHAAHTVGVLVEFMSTGKDEFGQQVRREEHEADRTKARNLQTLNESFATPVDREDIYRAIVALDEVVNYCKTTVYEMHEFAIEPDTHLLEMSRLLEGGVQALAAGFRNLPKAEAEATAAAGVAGKAERNIEKVYRAALADLFEGDDFREMFKRREVYRHMSNAGDRVAACASVLNDIIVKIN